MNNSDSPSSPDVLLDIEVLGQPVSSKSSGGILPNPVVRVPDLVNSPPDLVYVDGFLTDEYAVFLMDQRIIFSEALDEGTKVVLKWTRGDFAFTKRFTMTETSQALYWGGPADAP